MPIAEIRQMNRVNRKGLPLRISRIRRGRAMIAVRRR